MKKYIGTKEVKAQPMTAAEAIEKGYRIGNNTGNGYEVEYKDGYKSWSPGEVFEQAYQCAETPLDRMKIEHEQLEDKYEKLSNFIHTVKFASLGSDDRKLLESQSGIMESYLYILNERIKNAEKHEA